MFKIAFTLIVSFLLFSCNGFLNNEKDKEKKNRNNLILLGAAAYANQIKPLSIQETYEDGANFALPLKSNVTLSAKSPSSGSKYGIDPNLPAGLSLNTDTGDITGTPTEASGPTTYVVSQTKSDGSKLNYTFSIRTGVDVYVNGGAVAIKVGTAVTIYPVKHLNGSSYDISPALPSALSLDGNTGVISGTASAKTDEIQYTVIQTKPDGEENQIKFAMRVGDETDLGDGGTGGGGDGGGGGTPFSSTTATCTPVACVGSEFRDVVRDSSGNIFVVGFVLGASSGIGTVTYNFGNGVTVPALALASLGGLTRTGVLIKYNSSGQAQWAKAMESGDTSSSMISFGGINNRVAIDSNGNIYVAGVSKTIKTNFGTGDLNENQGYLLKYNSAGTIQWARTFSSSDGGTGTDSVNGLKVDGSGNIYLAATLLDDKTYTFGEGSISYQGSTYSNSGVVVKYNPSGTVQWASGGYASDFLITDLNLDTSGNVYISSKNISDALVFLGNFINGVAGKPSGFLIKLNSAGAYQFGRQIGTTAVKTEFNSVAVDGSGSIYVTGLIACNQDIVIGSQTLHGIGGSNGNCPLLVKYSASGDVVWARTNTGATNTGTYVGAIGVRLAIDGGGNPHVAFNVYSQSGATYDFGLGSFTPVTINNNNAVLVKYSSSGTVLSSKYATAAGGNHLFYGLTFDASGNPIAVGTGELGNYTYTGGLSFTTSGWYGHILLKF